MDIYEIGLVITIPSFIIYISPLKSIDFIKIFSVVMLLKSPDTAIFSLSHLGRNVHFFLFFGGGYHLRYCISIYLVDNLLDSHPYGQISKYLYHTR